MKMISIFWGMNYVNSGYVTNLMNIALSIKSTEVESICME